MDWEITDDVIEKIALDDNDFIFVEHRYELDPELMKMNIAVALQEGMSVCLARKAAILAQQRLCEYLEGWCEQYSCIRRECVACWSELKEWMNGKVIEFEDIKQTKHKG